MYRKDAADFAGDDGDPYKNRRGVMKRSREEIISQILEICCGGACKTKIVYQANLNFRTVNPYLDLLTNNEMIQVREGPRVSYETTQKGKDLLENYRIIRTGLGKIEVRPDQVVEAKT
jgi:predicted transcriptional regulator